MDSHRPPDFSRFIAKIARELQARQLPFMLIGGQAVLLHGSPRLTEDIDITLGVDPGRLPELLDVCAALQLEPLPEETDLIIHKLFAARAGTSRTRRAWSGAKVNSSTGAIWRGG
ncbi:MAG: hypothetical protein PVG79_08735 [Gemmatimonadales bacterium]|jgi:hypothetical protein